MSFSEFDQSQDISSQVSVINEVIPLTGSLFSASGDYYTYFYLNIQSGSVLSGGFFQTVYDGSPFSVSSSALIDLTFGISVSSSLATYAQTFEIAQKQRVYKEMAALLLGNKNALFTYGGQ